MKKLLLTLVALGITQAAFAQVEIGLKVSPGLSYFRANSPSVTNFQGDGTKFSFGGGIFADIFFGENYAFNTGIFLTGKGGTYTYTETVLVPSPTNPQASVTRQVSQKLGIQYLEVPATIKLFTNEIAPDTRLYFQVGGSLAFPVGARLNDSQRYADPYNNNAETSASDHVFAVDANLLGSVGAEYQLGKSTKFLTGISYHHGLIDLDRYFEKNRGFSDVSIRNSVFALDLGLKF